MSRIWIYLENAQSFKEMERDDERLDWTWKHAPDGMVRFRQRKNSERRDFCYYGDTREACALSANRHLLKEIAELEQKLASAKARLVK